jgi:hypothetical protein
MKPFEVRAAIVAHFPNCAGSRWPGTARTRPCDPLRATNGSGAGLDAGYHLVEDAKDQIPVPKFQGDVDSDPGPSVDERNTGLAVVVPFERIVDMIEDKVVRDKMDPPIEIGESGAGRRETGAFGTELR